MGARRLVDLLILNLMWLVTSLPVITLFPATAAVFGVMREWRENQEWGAFQLYLGHLRRHFGPSLRLALLWLPLAALLVVNFVLVVGLEGPVRLVLLSTNLAGSLTYVSLSAYLFPVLVHRHLSPLEAVRFALFLAATRLSVTLRATAVLLAFLTLSFVFPATVVLTASPAAYLVYRLCYGSVRELDRR